MKIEMIDSIIEVTTKNEEVTDMVLEIIYEKYQKLPKLSYIEKEIKILKAKLDLKAADKLFLECLYNARTWIVESQ